MRSRRSSLSNRNSGDLRIREELWKQKTCPQKAWVLTVNSSRCTAEGCTSPVTGQRQTPKATLESRKRQPAPARSRLSAHVSSSCHCSAIRLDGKEKQRRVTKPKHHRESRHSSAAQLPVPGLCISGVYLTQIRRVC